MSGDTGAGGLGLMVGRKRGLEFTQPVSAALDLEHLAVMQELVKGGGGEDLGPDLGALVGGDDESGLLVAMRDEPEEQRGVLTAHGLEADLVDDQQTVVDVLLVTQQRMRELGVAVHWGQQLIEAVEDDAEAVLDGFGGAPISTGHQTYP